MTTKKTTKNATVAPALDLALFTVEPASSGRGGDGCACYNANLRRLTLPRAVATATRYDLRGASGGEDALMLAPVETGGRAVHPTQHFVVIPKNLAVALKSTRYALAVGDGGVLVATPAPVAPAKGSK